ncbi:cobyrinic acid a,c-diamide synthase [Aureimonas ureilytica]|uniref:Hydrogenobyrinate a,c-diamide synthase n=1 Tax=Aureimonas ureilytica TaxID=401562 RepID=A0A175R422_9HYPH|nr:cobyrinate a,c-diamide synthase [Aureimonas ureilytica]KTQ86308.1 cobyrinic acid a,c-diamide synthase [Aureimonas ureilytica]
MEQTHSAGFVLAAPQSGSGKTLTTLALLRHLTREGVALRSAKAGPDYIDPAFHAAATGRPSLNLDPFAMRPDLLCSLAFADTRPLVVEAMMGLYDGAADGSGSAADLAEMLGLPVVFLVDCAKQSHSIAALVRGFRDHRPTLRFGGLMLNRVGSPRHETLLRDALSPLGLPILAVLPADPALILPERHLGLVQAGERADLTGFLERAADWIAQGLQPGALDGLLGKNQQAPGPATPLAPLGAHIAVARDTAFAFSYPHLLEGWRQAGAALSFFSPLADDGPAAEADAVFLPGGYPELHAGRLAAASRFREGMQAAARRGALIYGECGGYMALGEGLVDADGIRHGMLGLLPLETSFAQRKRHLGYRRLAPLPGAPWAHPLTGHEFHYATIVREGAAERLFEARDAVGSDLGAMGLRRGRVMGSFAHIIDGVVP